MMMAFSAHRALLGLIFAVLVIAGIVYARFDRSGNIALETVDRAEFSGTYACVRTEGVTLPQDVCAPVLVTDEGVRYALDFNLLGYEPVFTTGEYFSAAGVLTAGDALPGEYWVDYGVKGVLSVTEFTKQSDLRTVESFRGTLPCADCPGIDTVLTLTREASKNGGSYTRSLTYIDRAVEPLVEQGTWIEEQGTPLDADAVVYALHREGGEEVTGRYLKVSDTVLRELMPDGTPIDSGLPFDLLKVESTADDTNASTTNVVR